MKSMNSTIINFQLVESLIQAIYALSPAEQNLVRSRLLSTTPQTKQSIVDLLNEAPGQQLFQTPAEVDQYLQEERSSWDN